MAGISNSRRRFFENKTFEIVPNNSPGFVPVAKQIQNISKVEEILKHQIGFQEYLSVAGISSKEYLMRNPLMEAYYSGYQSAYSLLDISKCTKKEREFLDKAHVFLGALFADLKIFGGYFIKSKSLSYEGYLNAFDPYSAIDGTFFNAFFGRVLFEDIPIDMDIYKFLDTKGSKYVYPMFFPDISLELITLLFKIDELLEDKDKYSSTSRSRWSVNLKPIYNDLLNNSNNNNSNMVGGVGSTGVYAKSETVAKSKLDAAKELFYYQNPQYKGLDDSILFVWGDDIKSTVTDLLGDKSVSKEEDNIYTILINRVAELLGMKNASIWGEKITSKSTSSIDDEKFVQRFFERNIAINIWKPLLNFVLGREVVICKDEQAVIDNFMAYSEVEIKKDEVEIKRVTQNSRIEMNNNNSPSDGTSKDNNTQKSTKK